MKYRNGIEGTQSELVRGHGLRQARYRGLAKAKLQNYFIGAACNVKRWIRQELWRLQQVTANAAAQTVAVVKWIGGGAPKKPPLGRPKGQKGITRQTFSGRGPFPPFS